MSRSEVFSVAGMEFMAPVHRPATMAKTMTAGHFIVNPPKSFFMRAPFPQASAFPFPREDSMLRRKGLAGHTPPSPSPFTRFDNGLGARLRGPGLPLYLCGRDGCARNLR